MKNDEINIQRESFEKLLKWLMASHARIASSFNGKDRKLGEKRTVHARH